MSILNGITLIKYNGFSLKKDLKIGRFDFSFLQALLANISAIQENTGGINMQPIYRHEYKHIINRAEYYEAKSRFDGLLQKDEHTNGQGYYFVRSLYFDNLYDKVLREKQEGIDPREKFRIRLYNHDTSFIRLEKKGKYRGLTTKSTIPLSVDTCERIIGLSLSLEDTGSPDLLTELYVRMKYELLRPRTIVDYKREAYVFPSGNVRVNLDTEIRTGLFRNDFFNAALPTIDTGIGSFAVLEVKYDAFFPDFIADIVKIRNRHSSSVSKYCVCRAFA
jgi:hypothetical protein